MMDELFTPDIFSRSLPVFNPVAPALHDDVVRILAEHYAIDPARITSVTALDGLEVNSRNFKIIAGDKTYALKRSGRNARVEDSHIQLDVSQRLNAMGVRMPHIIPAQGLPYVMGADGHYWILSDFVEGAYFSGSSAHYRAVMEAVALLQSSLEACREAAALPLSSVNGSWDTIASIFKEFFDQKDVWSALFPEVECALLTQEADRIRACLAVVSPRRSLAGKDILPTHIDLHPHNILMKDSGEPVIVDVDSLQRTDKVQSLGFAVFKLTRQHIVQEKPDDISAPARQFMQALGVVPDDALSYYHAAIAEILRRVGIIISLNMRQSNHEWNKVLPLQLRALHEVSPIFGQEL